MKKGLLAPSPLMRFRIMTRAIPNRWGSSRTWISLLGVLALAALARLIDPSAGGSMPLGMWLPPCPLRYFSGLRCPFCGLTAGTAWLARGSFADAWQSNLLSPLFALAILLQGTYALVFRLISGRAIDIEIASWARRSLWVIVAAAMACSWVRSLLLS